MSEDQSEVKSSSTRIADKHAFFMGVLLGVPIAYPEVPFYLLSFLCFGSCFIYVRREISQGVVVLVLLCMAVALLSSLFGSSRYDIGFLRVLTTTGYFLFFLFGCFIVNKYDLLRGYLLSCLIISVSVIILFFLSGVAQKGLLIFLVPEFRLWGENYFPDWPNFLAFFLSVSFLLNVFVFKKNFQGFLSIVAALLTTSRTPIIAILLYVLFQLLGRNQNGLKRFSLFVAILLLSVFLSAYFFQMNPELLERLVFAEDRVVVYGFALDMFLKSPIIGHGAILFDSSVGLDKYESFHNSYLDILVRHGILGFAFFILLIIPVFGVKLNSLKEFFPILLFFLIASLFQNFFKHPHLIMLYSVIIYAQSKLNKRRQ